MALEADGRVLMHLDQAAEDATYRSSSSISSDMAHMFPGLGRAIKRERRGEKPHVQGKRR